MPAHIRWTSPAAAPISLLCLPYAGDDGAAFRSWAARLGPRVRVGWAELPGRGDHFALPPLRRIPDHVQWLLPEARSVAPPLVIFGYSMGALIGFELTHALLEARAPAPTLLMVAAHHAPGRPAREEPLHGLPKDEFMRRLASFEGMPAEVLAHAELLAIMTPRLRADFEACESYAPAPRSPLAVPLVAYGGAADREVPPEALLHWAPLTRARFECVVLSGNHLFLNTASMVLTGDISRRLALVEDTL